MSTSTIVRYSDLFLLVYNKFIVLHAGLSSCTLNAGENRIKQDSV